MYAKVAPPLHGSGELIFGVVGIIEIVDDMSGGWLRVWGEVANGLFIPSWCWGVPHGWAEISLNAKINTQKITNLVICL